MPEKTPFEDDEYYKRWIATYIKTKTRIGCHRALQLYTEYTGKTPTELIKEASDDQLRPPDKRTKIAVTQVRGFAEWLMKDAPKLDTHQKAIGKGVSSASVSAYTAYVRSFYANSEIIMKFSGRFGLPSVEHERHREIFTNEQIRRLIENTRKIKDKALIAFMYQSGADISTALGVKLKDLKKGQGKDERPVEFGDLLGGALEIPLKVRLYRPKTSVSYFSFLGEDAVRHLKLYAADLKARGTELLPDDPLWIKEKRVVTERDKDGKPTKYDEKPVLTPVNAIMMIRETSIKAGLISEDNTFNGYGAHALRATFATKLRQAGMDKLLIDKIMGHKNPAIDAAYFKTTESELRELYTKYMPALAIAPEASNGELRKKIDDEVGKKTEGLIRRVAELETKVMKLTRHMALIRNMVRNEKAEREKEAKPQ